MVNESVRVRDFIAVLPEGGFGTRCCGATGTARRF
jgi:hypothetical protein